ncbi:50S ribosomal protein L24 [Piscinibacter aquaticus]|uniref:Large ribosomal subunit protein uL24 n=1 Tax=Piscinibacter aquaticus TaxID=392597 RepID=A0A5C6U072_9BURK|nr:50S ribosomal protein L24 [Piscinibacter aquaticus]
MNKIRKGDPVIVLTGRDKGKRGTVTQRVDDERIVVEGVNIVKKHVKPNPMKGTTGGVVEKSMSIHQSNVAIYNAATGKADRVGVKLLADGRKVRVYKSSGDEIKA